MKVRQIFVWLLYPVVSVLAVASDWSVLNGGQPMFLNTTFLIKGSSYFGLETCDYTPHGLWVHPLTWYLDFLQDHKFNLIRLPFSQDWALHGFDTYKPNPWSISADPSLKGLTTLEIIDRIMDEAYKRSMFVLFDMHRLRCQDQGHELWYSIQDNVYTADTFFSSWEKVIRRWQNHPAFHGIDLLNEPRGLARWGSDPDNSWNLFVEDAFNKMDYYKGLIYVEGIAWGRDFSGMKDYPIKAPLDRVVFSPHTYGPSVAPVANMDVYALHADWDRIFGYLVSEKKCVVIGEFGGRYFGADRVWQDLFVNYLLDLRIPGIYWGLNPNSQDTGGLLADDWTSPMQDKLALLDRLQPNPTIIKFRRSLRGQTSVYDDGGCSVICSTP